jgi:hypothetical protein
LQLVNKVEITPSRIITRKSNGSTTFDTNSLYLKTDAGGSMFVGGFKRLPVYFGTMAVSTTNQVLPDKPTHGYPGTLLNTSNFRQAVSGQETWHDLYVPSGVTSFYTLGGDSRSQSGPTLAHEYYNWNNLSPVYYKSGSYNSGSWTHIGSLTLSATLIVFLANGQMPIPGPRTPTLNVAQMQSLYNSYGAGYYRIKTLPSNWASVKSSSMGVIRSDGTTSAGTNNKTAGEIINPTQYVQPPYLYPAINEAPTNIDVAVTP